MTRRLAVTAFAIAAWVVTAAPAWAHVSVDPSEAAQGGFTTLAFNVPNERDAKATTKVEIVFPADSPIPFVSVQPKPGWTSEVEKQELETPIETEDGEVSEVVSKVTWQGGSIKSGEFDRFVVSAGPMPDAEQLEFKALQTYDDGQVVRWIETTPEGGAEPEHPAPVLTLVEGGGEGETHGAATAESPALPKDVAKQSDVDGAKTLAIVAIVVGAIGALLGVGALVRGRAGTS